MSTTAPVTSMTSRHTSIYVKKVRYWGQRKHSTQIRFILKIVTLLLLVRTGNEQVVLHRDICAAKCILYIVKMRISISISTLDSIDLGRWMVNGLEKHESFVLALERKLIDSRKTVRTKISNQITAIDDK